MFTRSTARSATCKVEGVSGYREKLETGTGVQLPSGLAPNDLQQNHLADEPGLKPGSSTTHGRAAFPPRGGVHVQ